MSKYEWIWVGDDLPPMFEPVIVLGISSSGVRGGMEARRCILHMGRASVRGPSARKLRDKPEGEGKAWCWIAAGGVSVYDVSFWFPMPQYPDDAKHSDLSEKEK